MQQLVYIITNYFACQELFSSFFKFFQLAKPERRRRDLNPRAAVNDLLPFQGSPFGQLGYFSKLPYLFYLVLAKTTIGIISYLFSFVKRFFDLFFKSFSLNKRRGWDSNPRALADKRFSRPPRYDHFDTSPKHSFSLFFSLSVSAQVIVYHQSLSMSRQILHFFQFFSFICFLQFHSAKKLLL